MTKLIKSLLTEYGLKWTLNRALYSGKLKMMSKLPVTEKLFERKASVKRIGLFDFDVANIRSFLESLSEHKKLEVLSLAEKALAGTITGFSSIELSFGYPINWHLNPLTGVESRRDQKWYQIPDFDSKVGDIKVIWEASRLTHFHYFSRAFLITGEHKYYIAFSEQLKDWLDNNPYSYGANYKCGQEATLRMINTLMAYAVFKHCGVTTLDDEYNVAKLVRLSYKKVISNFFYAHKCIKNNHTFSEICGLIVGAWCTEDKRTIRTAYKLMDEEIRKQFLPDGGFTQYSFNYHRFTLQIIECLFKISEKTGLYFREQERIRNSVLLLYQMQAENGDVPNYGSNDGALIFPMTSCGYRDFRPVLNTVYALIEGKRLYDRGDYDEELLWFGSNSCLRLPNANIERKSSGYYDSGYYTFRHNGGFLMVSLQDFDSRPAHMDQLHVDLWHRGINILCDSGTYSYASEIGSELSSTAGHNTVKLPNTEQMSRNGAFLVTDWTQRKDVEYGDNFFKGTMVSKNGYKHLRSIHQNKRGYLITDVIDGDSDHCDFLFHTPCEVRIYSEGFRLYHNGKPICTVVTEGNITRTKAKRSLYYLRSHEINCVVVKYDMDRKCNAKFEIELY